jgi:hypothetical protein
MQDTSSTKMTDEKKVTGWRIVLVLLAGTLLSSTLVQWHGRPQPQSSRKRLRSGQVQQRGLANDDGNNDDGNNNDDYYGYTDDGNTAYVSSNSNNYDNNYDNNYLWARDDDDDYYTDDDRGSYWEANKNYKSSNYVSASGGGGSSVQGNNANYDSQTFDGSGSQENNGSYYQNADDDDEQGGKMNLGLLSSDQRIGLAYTISIVMVLLLLCLFCGPFLIDRCCGKRGDHDTQTDVLAVFSNLGDF